MAVSVGFKRMCPHTVTLKLRTGRDKHDEPTYEVTGTPYKARVVDERKLVRDRDGKEVVSDRQVWVAGSQAFGPDDQLVLPAGFTPQAPPIKSVARYPTRKGDHHMVIFL